MAIKINWGGGKKEINEKNEKGVGWNFMEASSEVVSIFSW